MTLSAPRPALPGTTSYSGANALGVRRPVVGGGVLDAPL